MSLYSALFLDLFTIACCTVLLWRYARLSAFHPASTYLLFHILVVTYRAYFVSVGSPTLFTAWGPGVIPLSDTEIAWAVNLADLALLSMTAAWVRVAAADRSKYPVTVSSGPQDLSEALLSRQVIRNVSAIAFPIGILALGYFAYVPAIGVYGAGKADLGGWSSSSWMMVAQSWPGLVLLGLIYYHGFRRRYVVSLCLYLLIMAIQGFSRFRLVIPLIYLAFVWLSRARRKWPPFWTVAVGLAVLVAIFPLKDIGWLVQSGASITDIRETLVNSLNDVTEGRASDQLVLDQFACTVSLVDESHHYFYGSLYYPLLMLPIPRQLWPEKPFVNAYQYELSNPSRPMAASGMVPTLHGESYANFGPFGIIITSYLAAYWLGRAYFGAMRSGYYSVYRFSYMVVACNLVQIFRDGLISLVIFSIVNMMPLVAIAILSYASFRREKARNLFLRSVLSSRARSVTQRST